MRKTFLYLAILAVLGFGIYYFLLRKTDDVYSTPDAGFTIKDTAAIGKIYIVSSDGEEVTVQRTDSGWIVNNKYKALPSTLNRLLLTLHNQEPLYPVTKNAYDNAVSTLASHGKKVELYGRDGKKMKVFYVGGSAVNNTGTNMLIEGAKIPYVVHMPGFVGYLTPHYPTALTDWRDRTVFSIPASEIKSVSVTYADHPEYSFTVSREGDSSIAVNIADKKAMNSPEGLNRKRAAMYFRFFYNINSEGYLNGLPDNDTTFKTAPKRSSIELTGMHGQHQRVEIYWMALNRRSKNQTKQEESTVDVEEDTREDYDPDRMYGVINNDKDTVMIQRMVFANILRKGREFYMKDAPPPKPTVTNREVQQDQAAAKKKK